MCGNRWGFPGSSAGKESACNAGDLDLIPGLGRSPGGGHGNPLQYSCLENLHAQRSLVGYSPWNSPGQNTAVDSLSLLWEIFRTQGSNGDLQHCRQILYQLSLTGSPNLIQSCTLIMSIKLEGKEELWDLLKPQAPALEQPRCRKRANRECFKAVVRKTLTFLLTYTLQSWGGSLN